MPPDRGARISRLVAFALSFAGGRAVAALSPFFLAATLQPAVYGGVELAQAIGMLAGVLALAGLHGAVPYFMLSGERLHWQDAILLHLGAVALGASAAAVLLYAAAASAIAVLSTTLAGLYAVQLVLSAYLRSSGLRSTAGWAEALLPLLLAMVTAGALVASSPWLGAIATPLTAVLAVAGAACLVLAGRHRRPTVGVRYRRVLRIGLPLLVLAAASLALISGGRFVVAHYLGLAEVGQYAFCMRIGLVLVVLHQAVTIFLFREIYGAPPRVLGRQLTAFLVLLTAGAAALTLVAEPLLLPIFADPSLFRPGEMRGLVALTAIQTIAWIAGTWLEGMISRLRLAGWAAGVNLAGLLGFVIAAAGLQATGHIGLFSLATAFALSLTLTAAGQVAMLWCHGQRLPIVLPALALPWVLLLLTRG